jgi:hypothetical protein
MPKLLIIAGGGLILIGLIWLIAERFGFPDNDLYRDQHRFKLDFLIIQALAIARPKASNKTQIV